MALKILTAATYEPLSLEEVRAHLRLTATGSPPTHPEDDLLTSLITAARAWAEQFLARALVQQTYELTLPAFPVDGEITLLAPLISVETVKYVDASTEVLTTLTDSPPIYHEDTYAEPGRILLKHDESWPSTAIHPHAVRVTFIAGYTDPNGSPDETPIPEPIRRAMLLQIGDLYENREAAIVGTIVNPNPAAMRLLSMYRLEQGL